jgi:hypothetical protein
MTLHQHFDGAANKNYKKSNTNCRKKKPQIDTLFTTAEGLVYHDKETHNPAPKHIAEFWIVYKKNFTWRII